MVHTRMTSGRHERPRRAPALGVALVCVVGVVGVLGLAPGCGGSQKSSGDAPSPDQAGQAAGQTASDAAARAKPGDLVILVNSSKSSNHGRPFRVVARAVDYNTYLTDTYVGVSNLVMTPDETVTAVDVVYPGRDTVLTMSKPDKDSIALYFLFTDPDAAWKTYLENPVSSTVALDDHSASTPVAAPDLEPPTPEEPGQDKKKKSGMPTKRKLALASGGVGVAALITGTVLGLVARSRYNSGLAMCTDTVNGTGCPQTAVDLGTSAQNLGLGANISFGVAAVGVAAGAILWFTTPSSSGESSGSAAAFQWQPYAGPREAGVMVRGSF